MAKPRHCFRRVIQPSITFRLFWTGVQPDPYVPGLMRNAPFKQKKSTGRIAVTTVRNEMIRPLTRPSFSETGNTDRVEQSLQLGAIMLLTRSEGKSKRTTFPVTSEVNFCRQIFTASSECLILEARIPLFLARLRLLMSSDNGAVDENKPIHIRNGMTVGLDMLELAISCSTFFQRVFKCFSCFLRKSYGIFYRLPMDKHHPRFVKQPMIMQSRY